jgi:hypothetical protein
MYVAFFALGLCILWLLLALPYEVRLLERVTPLPLQQRTAQLPQWPSELPTPTPDGQANCLSGQANCLSGQAILQNKRHYLIQNSIVNGIKPQATLKVTS